MKIHYDKKEDILFIEFNNLPIVRDISYGWNVNMGFTDHGIGQITILDAQADGMLPLELDEDVTGVLYQSRKTAVHA